MGKVAIDGPGQAHLKTLLLKPARALVQVAAQYVARCTAQLRLLFRPACTLDLYKSLEGVLHSQELSLDDVRALLAIGAQGWEAPESERPIHDHLAQIVQQAVGRQLIEESA